MLLKIGSLILAFLMTGYAIYQFNRNKERISSEAVSSLLVGGSLLNFSFLTIHAFSYNLPITIILSLLFAIGAGYLVGPSIHKMKGLNQILSGLIGATIGSLLGYMTFSSTTVYLAIDIVFLLFIYFLLKVFENATKERVVKRKGHNKKPKRPSYGISVTLGLVIILLVTMVNFNDIPVGIIGQPKTQKAVLDDQNNLQVATIQATPSGFNPKNTTLKANNMIKIVVNADEHLSKDTTLVSEDLKLHIQLKSGENMILLDNPLKGKYELRLEPSGAKGTLTVK